MDWMVMAIGAIFLIGFVVGIYKGAVKIAVSLAATVFTLIVVVIATPFVADKIAELTPADEMVKSQVVKAMAGAATSALTGDSEGDSSGMTAENVRKALKAAGITEEMLKQHGVTIDDIVNGKITSEDLKKYGISSSVLDGLNQKDSSSVEEAIKNADIPKDLQDKAIEMAKLPQVFKTMLNDNNKDSVYKDLGVKTFAEYVGEFLAQLIIHMVAFLCTFLLVTILVRAIVFALDIVANLPVLGFFNRLGGGAVGLLIALIIVWFLFIIVTLMYVTSIGREMYQTIQSNAILKMLYDYNPLLKLAMNFR